MADEFISDNNAGKVYLPRISLFLKCNNLSTIRMQNKNNRTKFYTLNIDYSDIKVFHNALTIFFSYYSTLYRFLDSVIETIEQEIQLEIVNILKLF